MFRQIITKRAHQISRSKIGALQASTRKGVEKQSKASKLVTKQGPELVARARRYRARQKHAYVIICLHILANCYVSKPKEVFVLNII